MTEACSAKPERGSNRQRTLFRRLRVSVLRIVFGVPIVGLLLGGAAFLLFSVSWAGRCVGLSAAVLGGTLYLSVGHWSKEWFRRARIRIYGITVPLTLVAFVVPACMAPSGVPTADSSVWHAFVGERGSFARFSPWNIVPEIDQITVGTYLMAMGDPHMGFSEARGLRRIVRDVYTEMEADRDFRRLGSVMGMGYRELARFEFRTGHYYVFRPEQPSGKRLPCIVFLHGIGGNWKSYLWVLSRISARLECVILAPTFGIGNWDKPGAGDFVVAVTREALATLPIDSEDLTLAGYSKGAIGVGRAAVKGKGLFKRLIFISPVTEDELLERSEFLSHYREHPVLFLHGARDPRIPRQFVEGTAAFLDRSGVDVTLRIYEEGDHFFLLAHRREVLDDIANWMDGVVIDQDQSWRAGSSARTGPGLPQNSAASKP